MMNNPAIKNKLRYQLLIERRRVLLDIARIRQAIEEHDDWSVALSCEPRLAQALELHFQTLQDCQLCSRACQAACDTLKSDVRYLYNYLIILAKVWVGLEDNLSENFITPEYFSEVVNCLADDRR